VRTVNTDARYLSEPGPMGLFTRLTRVGLLLDGFQHRCLDAFALKFIDYSVLRVLQLAGSPYQMTPGELSEIVLRSSGNMTQIIDRLQRAGYVERTADSSDRRKVVIALTPDGLQTAQKAGAAYARERKRIVKQLSPDEVARVDTAVRLLLDVFTSDAETASRA
jgi:DNA-binding MarR family transcriptional regulator